MGLTASAHRFVSATALTALTGREVVDNTWTRGDVLRPVHTAIAADHEAIAVYSASVAFLSSLAGGLGNSPFLLAALGTPAPVLLAPSLPPGVGDSPIIRDSLARLAAVPNYHLVQPKKGKSRSTGAEADTVAPMWEIIGTLEASLAAPQDRPVGRAA
ncbi:hypothetical protein AB0I61_15865 [Polymorphospora rubra]|uniref:hypothetical protein n=1 Tax=Polymorphospora rubra TaxID=338584 RepID=UPI0033D6DFEE